MSGWIQCLNESMSVWLNQFTCPGFMFVPRKPWPFGNEYHTICCGLSGILFRLEIVEGRDFPTERERPEFDEEGKTVGLLLRLTRPLWNQGKIVVLDSGFCVLKGIVELKKKGVFAAALIKKRRYWPKHIKGNDIINHFANLDVGDVNALEGTMDGVALHVTAMKEPDYVMQLMTTYGTLNRFGVDKTRIFGAEKRRQVFKYPEVVHNHYTYRHAVDDHNSRRQSPISLEETWATKWWPNQVFAFLLGVTEVNANLAFSYFYGGEKEEQLTFRRKLAKELIYNEYLAQERAQRRQRQPQDSRLSTTDAHRHATLAQFRKFSGTEMVQSLSRYPLHKCSTCPKRIRKYCTCSPGTYRCADCYVVHLVNLHSTS